MYIQLCFNALYVSMAKYRLYCAKHANVIIRSKYSLRKKTQKCIILLKSTAQNIHYWFTAK